MWSWVMDEYGCMRDDGRDVDGIHSRLAARSSIGHGKQPAATEGRDSCAGRIFKAGGSLERRLT